MTVPFDCVVVAAGESSRMGRWKLLLPFGGSTVIETVVDVAAAVCRRIVLVTGFRAEELEPVFAHRDNVTIVRNPSYRDGIYSSVTVGIREVRSEGFFLTLGDMPFVPARVFQRMYAENGRDPAAVHRPEHDGAPGHPVLFPARARELILAAASNRTEGTPPQSPLLREFRVVTHNTNDEGVVRDIDTPEDYAGAASGR